MKSKPRSILKPPCKKIGVTFPHRKRASSAPAVFWKLKRNGSPGRGAVLKVKSAKVWLLLTGVSCHQHHLSLTCNKPQPGCWLLFKPLSQSGSVLAVEPLCQAQMRRDRRAIYHYQGDGTCPHPSHCFTRDSLTCWMGRPTPPERKACWWMMSNHLLRTMGEGQDLFPKQVSLPVLTTVS